MQEQPSNADSVNLVQATVDYLVQLERFIDNNNVHLAIQALRTITDFVQGPCEATQRVLQESKLYLVVNKLFQHHFPECDEEDVVRMQVVLSLSFFFFFSGILAS